MTAYFDGVEITGGWSKLWSGIVGSTVWSEPDHVRIVWITLLALADRRGRILASVPGLALLSRVSRRNCENALSRLQAPDPDSRSKEHDGRRIEAIAGGWVILNYLKYRDMQNADQRRLQTREAVRRYRARRKSDVSKSKQSKPRKAQAEADAEAETTKRPIGPDFSTIPQGDRGKVLKALT